LSQIDNRNFVTTIAVVDKYGELVEHRDFLHLIPPRKRQEPRDGQAYIPRPGEEEEKIKHEADRRALQDLLREHEVDLIVVSADNLESRRLKKALSDYAMCNNQQDMMQDENEDDQENE